MNIDFDEMLRILGPLPPQPPTVFLSARQLAAVRRSEEMLPGDVRRTTFAGLDIVAHPMLEPLCREPDWPEGVTTSKPDWLTADAWIEHRQWMGDFFGWRERALVVA